jgi:hypothetical protein
MFSDRRTRGAPYAGGALPRLLRLMCICGLRRNQISFAVELNAHRRVWVIGIGALMEATELPTRSEVRVDALNDYDLVAAAAF